MQALYEADLGGSKIEDALNNLFEQEEIGTETISFAKDLAVNAWKNKSSVDSLIKKHSKGWSLERISAVDRSILRLAFYELMQSETPHQVVINEALELAKKYSTADAAKFINGVLGAHIKNDK